VGVDRHARRGFGRLVQTGRLWNTYVYPAQQPAGKVPHFKCGRVGIGQPAGGESQPFPVFEAVGQNPSREVFGGL
jgi:hypothetical protein